MSFFSSISHYKKRNPSKHMGPKYGGRSMGAKVYGSHPAAGYRQGRYPGMFGGTGHSMGAQMYGSHPAAGYRNGQYCMGGTGHMMGFTAEETASQTPRSMKIVTAAPASPAPTGTRYRILKGCAEVGPRGNVTVTYEDSSMEDIWGLTGNTLLIEGVKYYELIDKVNEVEGNRILAYVPLCLVEGTFRPITAVEQPPASNVLAACIEVIRNGNGAVRVVFEDGTTWEPEVGWVLNGNEPIINGVKHFEIINPSMGVEGRENPKLAPLCVVEGTFVGPSTDPVPGVMTVANIPLPEEPPPPPSRVPPTGAVFQPQPVPPPPSRVPPTRVPPAVLQPQPVAVPRPAPTPRPATPALPPLPRPPAPTPGYCETGDVYGVASFQQVAQGSQGRRCY